MLKFDGKELRNLEEQVLKNQEDIENLKTSSALAELGIKIITETPFASESDLPLPYDGDYGDGFLVGSEAPYTLYVWTRGDNEYNGTWFDFGPLNAPSVIPGPVGPQGIQGVQGERGSLWASNNGAPTISQSNQNGDQFLNTATGNVYEYQNGVWNITGNIKGPQGIQGIQGPKGDIGERGLQGIQGPQGEPGQWIQIIAELANIDQLPAPDSVPRYYAYIIPVNGVKHLYIISGDETLLWLDCGAFTGPQGETGPQGQQGIQGVPGVGITTIESGTTSQTQDGYTQTPITFTKTDNSTSTLNVLAKNGASVTSITAGTSTSSDGYSTTPITFNYSDSTNQTVNVVVKEPTDAPKYVHDLYVVFRYTAGQTNYNNNIFLSIINEDSNPISSFNDFISVIHNYCYSGTTYQNGSTWLYNDRYIPCNGYVGASSQGYGTVSSIGFQQSSNPTMLLFNVTLLSNNALSGQSVTVSIANVNPINVFDSVRPF